MRVIVTRPSAQAADWVQALSTCGVDADALPLIRIEPAADHAPLQAAWHHLLAPLASQGQPAQRPDLVMFVSANAVQHFMAARPAACAWPAGVVAAAPGPGTATALRQAGVPESLLEDPRGDLARFDSEGLWRQLSARSWQGRRVLVVRGEVGRNWFAEQMRQQGAEVDFVVAYRRLPPQLDANQRALLDAARQAPDRWCWHFSSSESVANLIRLVPDADWRSSVAAATHPRIAQAVRAAGFGRVALIAPTPQAVADWLRSAGAQDPSIQSAPQ
ncbi:MAG: uroporphyrinogen-III synthase [Rubrivivax sp.]